VVTQQFSFKEAQRKANRTYSERKLQSHVAKVFSYLWRKLNDSNAVWNSYLLEARQNSSQTVFTKIDKTEQALRVRKKIKKNYEGRQHTEASFTYLKQRWKKDADKLRRQQGAEPSGAATAISPSSSTLVSPITSPAVSPPSSRPSSPPLPPMTTNTQEPSPWVNRTSEDVSTAEPAPETVSTSSSQPISPIASVPPTPIRRNSSGSGGPAPSAGPVRALSATRPRIPLKEKRASLVQSIEQEVDDMLSTVEVDDFELVADSNAIAAGGEDSVDASIAAAPAADLLFSSKCELVLSEVCIPGRLDVNKTKILFYFDRESAKIFGTCNFCS